MTRASIVVDFRHIRCDNCKVALHDELTMVCPVCGAEFDSITSNHVTLAAKLERRREAAGIHMMAVQFADADDQPTELVSS